MTGSLAYRKNEAAILRGEVPEKYTRLLPFIHGQRILEFGSAEGVLALLLAKEGRYVTALERQRERHDTAQKLAQAWRFQSPQIPTFVNADIADHLHLMARKDTVVAVRSIYYLGENLDKVFAAASDAEVPNIVLCGNQNRAARWRQGIREETKADNYYASQEGMRALLERHGYRVIAEETEGDPIVVGCR